MAITKINEITFNTTGVVTPQPDNSVILRAGLAGNEQTIHVTAEDWAAACSTEGGQLGLDPTENGCRPLVTNCMLTSLTSPLTVRLTYKVHVLDLTWEEWQKLVAVIKKSDPIPW